MRFGRTASSVLQALLAAALFAARAHAAVLASDSFSGATGTLQSQGGGAGWDTMWVTGQPNVFRVTPGSLSATIGSQGGALLYDGSLAAAGTGARVFRRIDCGPASAAALAGVVESHATLFDGTRATIGKPGTSVWLGYVFHGGTAGNGVGNVNYLAQMHLYDGATVTSSALAQGDNNKNGEAMAIGRGDLNVQWNFERTCAHDNCPGGSTSSSGFVSTTVMDSSTHWVVMRYDFVSAASTQVTMWLDPAPGAVAPGNASALLLNGQSVVTVPGMHFNWIELGGQVARFAFDEIRLATTFGDLSTNGTLAVPAPRPLDVALAVGPSPFADGAGIAFTLARAGDVEVSILDVAGSTVRTLARVALPAGTQQLRWDGRDDLGRSVAGGIYFVRVRADGRARTVKVTRIR